MEPFSTLAFEVQLNNCDYHLDLLKVLFHHDLRDHTNTFITSNHAIPLVEAIRLQRWLVCNRPLKRNPFSVRTHSAGGLLHTPLAGFNFHYYSPAVKLNTHPLWHLMREHLST